MNVVRYSTLPTLRRGTGLESPHSEGRVTRGSGGTRPWHTTGIILSVSRQPPLGTWLFTWTGGTAPYSVWLDGVELTSGLTSAEYEFTGAGYEEFPPPIEVISIGETAQNYTHPPRVRIQWRGIQAATAYIVERYDSVEGTWLVVHDVMERGAGYYSWTSQALDDAMTYQYRVRALDLRGNEGTPISFTTLIVRNPAPPSVSFAISSGDVVVS